MSEGAVPEALSRTVARAAIALARTDTRQEEYALKRELAAQGIRAAAADYGGDFDRSMMKMVERIVSAAKRDGVITDTHHEEGAVAGAVHEALTQAAGKAMGLPVGGKLAVARSGEHVAAAVFLSVGLMHLDEICVGMGHRSI